MFWRSPTSITEQTDLILARYLFRWNNHVTARAFEVLFTLGTKASHPYQGIRTFHNLEKMEMAKRDVFWSEVVRNRSYGSAFNRLVDWCEAHKLSSLPETNVIQLINLLSLLLTTVDRKFRDRVTKIIVRLGETHHRCLFAHTVRCLSFSDLYVPERMLAASYGVAMSQWAFPQSPTFQKDLVKLAKIIAREVFIPGGKVKTTHILIRDYSLGIIALAEKMQPRCIATHDKKYLKRPFIGRRGKFPSSSKILDEDLSDVSSAIHMDFENYTIGRLVSDRGNYDNRHPKYQEILKKIKWRIRDLGYSKKRFGHVDDMIGRYSYSRSLEDGLKVDRYGKKYSWIAYFEMCGVIDAKLPLREETPFERLSDCDIDPSFPKRPPSWDSRLQPRLVTEELDDPEWIANGPTPDYSSLLQVNNLPGTAESSSWILLDGFILEAGPRLRHDIFTYFHGHLVKNNDLNRLKQIFPKLHHPEQDFQSRYEDHYTFAGEVPWSSHFAAAYRSRSGSVKSFQRKSYVVSKRVKNKKKVKKAWKMLLDELGDTEQIFPYMLIDRSDEGNSDRKRQSRAHKVLSSINELLPQSERIVLMDFFTLRPTNNEIRAGFQVVEEVVEGPGIMIENASWSYSWESYHSVANDFSGFCLPSPLICETLKLLPFRREVELRDPDGSQATAYREWEDSEDRSHFLYLRRDLLNTLLKQLNCSLVLVAWGERRIRHEKFYETGKDPKVKEMLQKNYDIHSRLLIYEPSTGEFVESISPNDIEAITGNLC